MNSSPNIDAAPEAADKAVIWLGAGFVVTLLLSFVQLSTLTGIPAHPLLLHMPVIFVPCLALAALVFAFRADWRRRFVIAYAIGALVTTAGTTLAAGAGEAWEHKLDGFDRQRIHDHAELGDKLHVVVIVFVALILIQVALDRGFPAAIAKRFADPRATLAVLLSVAIGIFAVGAGVLTMITGHEGAKAVFGKNGELSRGGDRPLQQGAPDGPGRSDGDFYGGN
jgi:hypothetical protein